VRHRNAVIVAIAAFAVALAGTVLGLAGSAGQAGATTSHSAATVATGSPIVAATGKRPRYVVLDCDATPRVRPGSYVLACADDGIGLQDLHWTSWTARLASGYGTLYENDCTPNCADGHLHYYRALAMLWGSAAVTGHSGMRQYTKLTLIFSGKQRPPAYQWEKGKLVATHPLTQTFGT
jgi:hypothetical protein